MKRILFVDDDSNVLQGLQRMLRPLRNEWEMAFAPSGAEALTQLAATPFDVIVTDMRMPGMNGAQLLTEVRELRPESVRIILSGQSDQETTLRSVGPAHQYLSKPCDAQTLKDTITRACALQSLLTSPELQRLVSWIQSLPSLPLLYTQIVEALQSPDVSTQMIGDLIAGDIGMTAKMLQLVNSAFFGLPRQVCNPGQAVSLLGLDTVKALVLSVQVFSLFDTALMARFALGNLWQHSLTVAAFAKQIAQAEGQTKAVVEAAYTAGLLHDAGKLILAANLPVPYGTVHAVAEKHQIALEVAERKTLGTSHAEVGAYLLGLWGIPHTIVEALAYHHTPSSQIGREFNALTAVHVANCLALEATSGDGKQIVSPLDLEYLTALDLAERLPAWRTCCKVAQ